ncbi:MAG TPA: glycerophosphodiester phosphodiesterase [Terriglobales bacterium]|nr:glycerophosphodiester phosphodiesterase [Terriglobales bacterium]
MISTSTNRPLLLGHRGARRYAPENTLTAFDLALQHGCDGFEFDVRLTADRRAVICHDPNLSGLEIARNTYTHIYARAGGPPSLEHVLARFASRAFLDIELKVAELEDSVYTCLQESPARRGYVVSSFLPEVVKAVAERGLVTGLICDTQRELGRWTNLPGQYVMPHFKLVNQKLVEQIHAGGRKVFVWTVNDERQMCRLADWGVDAIISDDTVLLARTFPSGL